MNTETETPAVIARRALGATFALGSHRPSTAQWDAIQDLLDHLQQAADGILDPAVYLSAIPAGTGKSQTLMAYAGALMGHPGYSDVGMLITCNRVSEVDDIARGLSAHRARLHIRVGQDNRATLDLGAHSTANGAQLVVSTQEALRRALRGVKDFGAADTLHYLGKRRAVLAWDEAISFHSPVLLDAGGLGALSDLVGRQGATAAMAELDRWKSKVREAKQGQISVPDFGALELDFARLEQDAEGADDALVNQAKALHQLSGGTGFVMHDYVRGRLVVTHTPQLPESLAPVIVTDASAAEGVNRERYRQMAAGRQVRWLKGAGKSYSAMTIRLVPVAASRSVYANRDSESGRDLIEMAVRYVGSVPIHKPVLVISYKKHMRMKGVRERTISAAIDARLTPQDRPLVRHLTWGQHTATNDHREVKHLLIMGLPFPRPAAAHATSAATLGKLMRSDDQHEHPTEDQVAAISDGMLRDAVLQAVLRGHARISADGDCGSMEVVIAQSPQSGLSVDAYKAMFPGVAVHHDHVLMPPKPLRGNAKRLTDEIARQRAEGCTEMRHPDLQRAIGIASRQSYAKLINSAPVVAWLTAQGFASRRFKGGVTGIQVIA